MIRQVGVIDGVRYNGPTGRLWNGHLRKKLFGAVPATPVVVLVTDLSEEEETLALATFDPLATLAGALNALFTKGAEPSALSITRTVDPLLMTIIGGTGTNPGPVVGAAVLHLGETFFSKSDLHINLNFTLFHYSTVVDTKTNWRLALGIVFIVIVMVIPHGLVGQTNRLWFQMRRWCRRFGYDPVIRRYPHLAAWMEPFTGEPVAVAQTLAQRSTGESLRRWALEYPIAAIYAALIISALAGSLIMWNAQTGFHLILFLGLITLPIVVVIWLYRNQETLKATAQRTASRFGLYRR